MSVPPTERWLDAVCAHVRGTRRRAAVRAELSGHLDDRIRILMASGMSAEQAVEQAILSMGDPDKLGRALAAADRPMHRLFYWLLLLFLWATLLILVFTVLLQHR